MKKMNLRFATVWLREDSEGQFYIHQGRSTDGPFSRKASVRKLGQMPVLCLKTERELGGNLLLADGAGNFYIYDGDSLTGPLSKAAALEKLEELAAEEQAEASPIKAIRLNSDRLEDSSDGTHSDPGSTPRQA